MTDFATELLYFAGALGATVVAVGALHVFIVPLVRRATEATETDIDQLLVGVLTLPVYLAVLVAGVYVALLQLSPLERQMGWIRQGAVLAATLLGFYALLRVFNALMRRHIQIAEEREDLLRTNVPALQPDQEDVCRKQQERQHFAQQGDAKQCSVGKRSLRRGHVLAEKEQHQTESG